MPGAAENFKPAEDPFNKTPDWLGTLAGLLEECARSTATASVLPRTSERAKGGKELQARLAAEQERHCSPYISAISPQARLAAEEERQNSARAKLLLCRTKMAWATFTARNKESLAVPWSAWQKLVRICRVRVRVWAGLGLGLSNPSPNPNSYP